MDHRYILFSNCRRVQSCARWNHLWAGTQISVMYDYNSNFDSRLLLYSYLISYMDDINQSDDQIQYKFLQDSVFPNLAVTLCWYIEL